MLINIPEDILTKIGGDKGYITKKKVKLNNKKRVKIITPKRKNQLKQNTEAENKYLEKRGSIEMVFRNIKQYSRIMVRKDKYMKNYISFFFLAVMNDFCVRNKLV
jgi:hypothetical protein